MTRNPSIILLAAACSGLVACGPADPVPAPAREDPPAAPAAPTAGGRSCDYLAEFVDSATLKPVAPPLRISEASVAPSGAPTCPQLPRGWRPADSPLGGGAEPPPATEAADRLAQARRGGKKATLMVSLMIR
jgi:hypothetical protein